MFYPGLHAHKSTYWAAPTRSQCSNNYKHRPECKGRQVHLFTNTCTAHTIPGEPTSNSSKLKLVFYFRLCVIPLHSLLYMLCTKNMRKNTGTDSCGALQMEKYLYLFGNACRAARATCRHPCTCLRPTVLREKKTWLLLACLTGLVNTASSKSSSTIMTVYICLTCLSFVCSFKLQKVVMPEYTQENSLTGHSINTLPS